jgi:putative membrane protein insertion efficiency factor
MKNLAIFLIKIYQRLISPYFAPRCKYYPSCSNFALDAYGYHGFFKGSALTIWRLLRCNPFSNGGVDYAGPRELSVMSINNLKNRYDQPATEMSHSA